MTTNTNSYPVSDLHSQLMCPESIGPGIGSVALKGARNYRKWDRMLNMHIHDTHPDWYEYATTGKIESIIQEYSPSDAVIYKIISILDTALAKLLINNCKGAAKKEVERYLSNEFSSPTGKGLFDHLRACFDKFNLSIATEAFYEINDALSMSLEDQYDWVIEITDTIFRLSAMEQQFMDSLPDDHKILYGKIKGQQRNNAAALLLMGINPKLCQRFCDVYGAKDTASPTEIYATILQSSMGKKMNQSLVATNRSSKKKSRQRHSTSKHVCFSCKGNHAAYNCPQFIEWQKTNKRSNPDGNATV